MLTREGPDPCIFTGPRARRCPKNLHFYGSGRGEAPKPVHRSDPGRRRAPPRLRRPGTRKNARKKATQVGEKYCSSAPAPSRVNILNHSIHYYPSPILYIPTNPHASEPLPGGGGLEWAAPIAATPGKHDFHAERQGGYKNDVLSPLLGGGYSTAKGKEEQGATIG